MKPTDDGSKEGTTSKTAVDSTVDSESLQDIMEKDKHLAKVKSMSAEVYPG